MISIENFGNTLRTDNDGFLISQSHISKIVEPWRTAAEAVKQAYLQNINENLHSVYIRGSVARGQALAGISDIDSYALVNIPREDCDTTWIEQFSNQFRRDFPFADGVEVILYTKNDVLDLSSKRYQSVRLMIKTQAVCLFGEDIAEYLPRIRPGVDTVVHLFALKKDIDRTLDHFPELNRSQRTARCTWIMKRIVRAGYELVMEREQAYTRDLYPCYQGFARHYPEHATTMRQAVDLALNPVQDYETIRKVLDGLGNFISERKILPH